MLQDLITSVRKFYFDRINRIFRIKKQKILSILLTLSNYRTQVNRPGRGQASPYPAGLSLENQKALTCSKLLHKI